VRSRLVLLLVLSIAVGVAGFGLGGAGTGSSALSPTTAASAWAIRITIPGQASAGTSIVSDSGTSSGGAFTYPVDGSLVSAQTTTASATTSAQRFAVAKAESDVTGLSLFGGEITADGVSARASAGTGFSGAGGNQLGSTVTNLVALGQPVTGTTTQLADWGTLALDTLTVDRSAPAGTRGYQGRVVELDVKLTAAHAGLPAGTEIQIGFAQAAVQTPPPAPKVTTTATTTATTATSTTPTGPSGPQPKTRAETVAKVPLKVHPPLGSTATYDFPVFGLSAYIDTFGAPRAHQAYHQGEDIFGTLGQPVVAVTDGTVFALGYDQTGGNQLWILDAAGNEFYYAHLSAFSTAARNGSHVRAGEVIGFMGNSGDAGQTPVHLHFAVHPASLLYLGTAGVVDPTSYLNGWQHLKTLPYPIAPAWAPNVHGLAAGPEPGAILLGMSDISSADGLDPASIRRALAPSPTVSPAQGPATKVTAPIGDLGATYGPTT
jgi:murein DD-endopeptidase MepM/ murein hydrolase activator NlpD